MSLKAERAPDITRVHTLHRIRTIVNYVNQLNQENVKIIDDNAIATHLIKTHLSKPTTKSFRDQIGRRARDHLSTARYLGLLYRQRVERKFTHMTTLSGKKLSNYSFEQECPKDYSEEAVFIDKICRMKMANVSYMQTPGTIKNKNYRERIGLNILAALKINNSPLSVQQLGTVLTTQCLDIFFNKSEFDSLIARINSKAYKEKYLEKLTKVDINNIRRDTNPFIDWCAQLDLVRRNGDFVEITERGKVILDFYGRMMPLWWHDFMGHRELSAAIFLLMNCFKIKGDKYLIKKFLKRKVKVGLFEESVEKTIRKNLDGYYTDAIESNLLFDFNYQYDVPPRCFAEVIDLMQDLLDKIEYEKPARELIKYLEFYTIKRIETKLKKESAQKTKEIKDKQKIDVKVLSTSVLSQISVPYEAATYLLFKAIESDNFKIDKYQAQLSEFFIEDPQYKKFSLNNPDLILTNDFLGLIECKSKGEWGDTIRLEKKTMAELELYHNYCNAIKKLGLRKNCQVIFSYEGKMKDKEKAQLKKLLKERFTNLIIITEPCLKKALIDVSTKNFIKAIISGKEPKEPIIEV